MVTISTHPTLFDLTKRLAPDDSIDTIVEMLHQTNEILDDMVWVEGNLPTGHRTTTRTGLPTPTWRKLYGGVQPTKSRTEQVTDTCGMLEAYAEVDKALADLNGNTAEFRLSEDRAHIEGMNQEHADTLITGNEGSEPEAFTGLHARFNDENAENGDNLIDGSDGSATDTGNNTSIYLCVWGPNTIHGIVPKGSRGGIQMSDKGQVTVENASDEVGGSVGGGRFEAYRTHYRWDCGLSVRDWRYVVRIANVNTSNLTVAPTAGGAGLAADLIDLMTQALELVPNLNMGRPSFLVNRTVRSFLRRQMVNKVAGSTLQMQEVAGKRVLTFDDVPVRRTDALATDEGIVTFA